MEESHRVMYVERERGFHAPSRHDTVSAPPCVQMLSEPVVQGFL